MKIGSGTKENVPQKVLNILAETREPVSKWMNKDENEIGRNSYETNAVNTDRSVAFRFRACRMWAK